MEATGYPDGKYPKEYKCPICGSSSCCAVYKNMDKEIVGCDDCLIKIYVDDLEEQDA
jgi:transcription elongation factor Elf1